MWKGNIRSGKNKSHCDGTSFVECILLYSKAHCHVILSYSKYRLACLYSAFLVKACLFLESKMNLQESVTTRHALKHENANSTKRTLTEVVLILSVARLTSDAVDERQKCGEAFMVQHLDFSTTGTYSAWRGSDYVQGYILCAPTFDQCLGVLCAWPARLDPPCTLATTILAPSSPTQSLFNS